MSKTATIAAPATTDTVEVEMVLDRETKGTYVYKPAEVDGAEVTGIYVQKSGFPNGAPANIILTIAAV